MTIWSEQLQELRMIYEDNNTIFNIIVRNPAQPIDLRLRSAAGSIKTYS